MNNRISNKFTLPGLIRFSLPAIAMLVLSSLYTMVDGVFVSRFVGSDALSSINIVVPLDYFIYGLGVMFGSGGSAVIGRRLGEGRNDDAKSALTLITLAATVAGIFFSVIFGIFMEPISRVLGAGDKLMPYCVSYGRIIFSLAVFTVIQLMNNTLIVTAGHPRLALVLTIISGVLNMVLDYFFIVVCDMGINGAALGTIISRIVGALLSVIFLIRNKKGLTYKKPKWEGRMLLRVTGNGSSEMISNLSSSVTTFLFNLTVLRLVGDDGVAAITIILYMQYFFTAVYLGFSTGTAPVISYNYGREDWNYIRKLFRYCMIVIIAGTAAMMTLSYFGADILIGIFSPEGSRIFQITYDGYMIFIWNFAFAGINIFASSMFSAFGNGMISALISILRTLVFIVASIMVLPKIWGIYGMWMAIPVAEALTFVLVVPILIIYGRKKYHYI